jgi:8-oxo-dGTP pyrophosphatase MutT (NUDIX family)
MLRESSAGLQVFMVVRHHQIDFASGALVFPGGKADEADFADTLINHLDGADDDPYMRGIQVAAIREAFEECGILLARAEGDSNLIDAERLASLADYRERLNNGDLSISEFVQTQKLRLACDQLVHYAHWVTPDMMPKRFDTHFYLALAPEDHLAVHDGYESVDSIWIDPAQALADAAVGTRTVIFPTLALSRLTCLKSGELPAGAIKDCVLTQAVCFGVISSTEAVSGGFKDPVSIRSISKISDGHGKRHPGTLTSIQLHPGKCLKFSGCTGNC